jgi:deoxycytidine triphosphate deaminase
MSDAPDCDPRILFKEKERLSALPYFQRSAEDLVDGVLLSDRIKYYCGDDFRLVDPFCEKFLRPAGYDLRVGFNYAIRGDKRSLNYGDKLIIGPYQVAIIQTLETLNIPDFLIGRWNIRVALAYKGLLWVGGAQVDPGFRGKLSCPIYNLSREPVDLECGEKLAMIDFVTTTRFVDGLSKPFQWWDGKKLVFEQYSTDLHSGVEHNLDRIKDELKQTKQELDQEQKKTAKSLFDRMSSMQSRTDVRIDTFLTLVFTVVAVLFAGLGIVATKGSDDPSFVTSPVWVAAVALYFALKPYALIWSEERNAASSPDSPAVPQSTLRQFIESLKPKVVEVLVAVIIVAGSVGFHLWHAHVSAKDLDVQKRQVEELSKTVREQKENFDMELQAVRVQSDAKIQSLQEQIQLLKRK